MGDLGSSDTLITLKDNLNKSTCLNVTCSFVKREICHSTIVVRHPVGLPFRSCNVKSPLHRSAERFPSEGLQWKVPSVGNHATSWRLELTVMILSATSKARPHSTTAFLMNQSPACSTFALAAPAFRGCFSRPFGATDLRRAGS